MALLSITLPLTFDKDGKTLSLDAAEFSAMMRLIRNCPIRSASLVGESRYPEGVEFKFDAPSGLEEAGK